MIFVSGDRGPPGAISWAGLRDDGAFKSHFGRSFVGMGSCTVESAIPMMDCVLLGLRWRIGTNADFTTSICSSSESSESCVDCTSADVFIFAEILCADDGGLEDDGLDDAGDSLEVFIRSTFIDGIVCAILNC